MSRRRERRTTLALPIVAHSSSKRKKSSLPNTGCTLDVTPRGARLHIQSDWKVGELIWVERGGKRGQFRVCWVGEPGAAKQRQIGIECVDSRFDWGVPLPEEPDQAVGFVGSPNDSDFHEIATEE